MDSLQQKRMFCALTLVITSFMSTISTAGNGYFQLHNLMSAAQKNVPNNLFFNDTVLNLENKEKGSGHVVNTQFANDGGVAGCGVSSTLMQYMYQKANVNLSSNYIALNVYSQVMGFDPQAPFWGDPEGSVKGYLTQGANIAYPFTPYHRVIPSLYPAYLGLYNNGLNCGRWVEANFDTQSCLDRTSSTGISKSCPTMTGLTYSGQKMQGYVFDSCEDNNGWCRDDAAHIDVNGSAFIQPNNYYLQWKFISNPYYSDANAPAAFKDIWLAWFSQASPYWSYVAILNAQNGISNVQYNVGDPNNPTWINSHVLAGDNNITWSSTSNNGQLWQVEPVNALTDNAPSANPLYQMRLFDYLGYPAKNGMIYQFQLLFNDGTLGQNVAGYSFFYQGGLAVKPGAQTQNMTLLPAPGGTGTVTVSFSNLLPPNVTLDATQTNYLRPVLISDSGYAYDPSKCTATQCVFSNVPVNAIYHLFAHAIFEVSNDLTLRKVNDVAFNSGVIQFPLGPTSLNYTVKTSDRNLSTLYAARVQIPLSFATTSLTPINANLQALFVPNTLQNSANNITAQTQGCFLNTYVNAVPGLDGKVASFNGNNSVCTVYYTVNNQNSFTSTLAPPSASFTVIVANHVGVPPVNYMLNQSYSAPIEVTGYNPMGTQSPLVTVAPMASYQVNTNATRSLYFILDPNSDVACLQNLDPAGGVSVSVGTGTPTMLSQPGVPVEVPLAQTGTVTAKANMKAGSPVNCQALSAIVTPLSLGVDTVDVIKLQTVPVAAPPKPVMQGISATAAGDAACQGWTDSLIFSSNGSVAATAAYTPNASPTQIGVNVPPGTYTISDKPFNVAGGSCQLTAQPSVAIQTNLFTPVTLNYHFTSSPSATCTATAKLTGSWQNGCTVQVTLASGGPLSNVTLSWVKGNWNWSNVTLWGGEGSLIIPSGTTGNVTWLLPSWVNGQGSSVGFNVNNDGTPAICGDLNNGTIKINCAGKAASPKKMGKSFGHH